MQQITFSLPSFKDNTCNSERATLLKDFIDVLNSERVSSGFKPLSKKFYAVKMSHLSVSDMYAFYSECKHAKSFSKFWWWALKPNHE